MNARRSVAGLSVLRSVAGVNARRSVAGLSVLRSAAGLSVLRSAAGLSVRRSSLRQTFHKPANSGIPDKHGPVILYLRRLRRQGGLV